MTPALPPKILLAVPRLNIGGAESYVATLASSLRQRGYPVILASGGGVLAQRLVAQGFRHYRVPMGWSARLAGWQLAAIMRREGVALLHANSSAAAKAAYQASRHTGIPWVMTAHSLLLRARRYACFRHAARIICVSEFQRAAEIAQEMFEVSRLVTMYNGIDLARFSPRAAMPDLRRDWGFSPEDFVIVLAARMRNARDKGHLDLFQVLAQDPRAAHWKLLVAGQGRALPLLQRLTRRSAIAERVRFVGHTLSMDAVYYAGDVICLPSKRETFGLSIAEGMAMAKPAVAYAVGGLPEVIADGVTGFLVPLGDLPSLGDRLDDLCQHPAQAREMGARARVEQLFTLDHMLDQVEELYQEVLKERSEF